MQTVTGPKVEKSPTLEPRKKDHTTETLRVVTRAQAKKAHENGEKLNESETLPKDSGKQQARDENAEQVDQTLTSKDTDSGGLVLVDKVNETLETILKAYEKWLTADTTMPPKLKEYPSPIQEKVNLVRNHALIRDKQTMLEGPPSFSMQRHPLFTPELEAISETSERELASDMGKEKSVELKQDTIPSFQEERVEEL